MFIFLFFIALIFIDYFFIGLAEYVIYEMRVKYSKGQYYVNIRKSRRGLSLRDRSQD